MRTCAAIPMVVGALAIAGCSGSGPSSYTCAEIAASTDKAEQVWDEWKKSANAREAEPGTLGQTYASFGGIYGGSEAVDEACAQAKPEDNAIAVVNDYMELPNEVIDTPDIEWVPMGGY